MVPAVPLDPAYRPVPRADAFRVAAAALVASLAVRLSYGRLLLHAPGPLRVAGGIAGILPGVLVVSLLDAFAARADLYPLGLMAGGAAVLAWSGRDRWLEMPAGIYPVAAFLLATGLGLTGRGDPRGLLAAFLLLVWIGRAAAGRLPVPGGVLCLASTVGALALGHRILAIDLQWQPLVLLLLAAAFLQAPRVRMLAVGSRAAWMVAGPILALGGLGFAALAAVVTTQFPTLDGRLGMLGRPAVSLAAVAFVLAGISLGSRFRGLLRRVAPLVAGSLAVFAFAPVNSLIEGGVSRYWRPDVEMGLLAVAIALLLPGGARKDRRKRDPRSLCDVWVYLTAVSAIVLTVFDVRHVSTPLAFLAVSLACLCLFLRTRDAPHAELHGLGLVATAVMFTIYAAPRDGEPRNLLPVMGAVAAVVVLLLDRVAAFLRGREEDGLSAAGERFPSLLTMSGLFIISCVFLSFGRGLPAAGAVVDACAVFACAVVIALSLRTAVTAGMPRLAYVAVAALLALYGYLALRTDILSFLDDVHPHALAAMGFGLLVAAGNSKKLAGPLARSGLWLQVPAVITGLVAILFWDRLSFYGSWGGFLRRASSALFLAAGTYAVAARVLERPRLRWRSVVMVNLAIFAFWRSHGIVDLAFYGVPPGLTLLLISEVLRGKIGRENQKALFFFGIVLLYGSIGVQVLRVDEPTHALVLFGLALATVVVAFALRRDALLATGTTVVVLDVVAYIARHGLEKSFLGAALLVSAGLTVLTVAALATRRRRGGA